MVYRLSCLALFLVGPFLHRQLDFFLMTRQARVYLDSFIAQYHALSFLSFLLVADPDHVQGRGICLVQSNVQQVPVRLRGCLKKIC